MFKEKILTTLNDRYYFLKNYLTDNLPKIFYRTAFNKKISQAKYIQHYKLSPDYRSEIITFWEPYDNINLLWHRAFSAISGIQDPRYIPEDIFYKKIEPTLNRYDLAPAYIDKNMTDKIFYAYKRPKTLLRNMNGSYYDADYQLIHLEEALAFIKSYAKENKIILKPSIDSGAGKNIEILDFRGRNPAFILKKLAKLFKDHSQDFIVQNYLYQHDLFSQMHEESLNTIRLISLRLDGKIHILSKVVRMGNDGSYTDNSKSGSITCGFDESGYLDSYAVNHWNYEIYKKHPFSHFEFKGKRLPSISESLDLVKKAHEQLIYFDLVSWDIAIDRLGEPNLIEIGVNIQDINYHQRTNGPLFGALTNEVLKKVYGHP